MAAGYSKTPLAKKLGIRERVAIVAVDAPDHYPELLAPLPEGAVIRHQLEGGRADSAAFVHVFAREHASLEAELPRLVQALARDGILWISWPKKAATRKSAAWATDLDGNRVRTLGLAAGLVDTKVCAIDEIWSGLKFVYRLEDR
ncbi:MAG: hypothetical protein MI919_42580 [Holophagales bacterium]|nr:hypothetical protein [Holophagales bacterium]